MAYKQVELGTSFPADDLSFRPGPSCIPLYFLLTYRPCEAKPIRLDHRSVPFVEMSCTPQQFPSVLKER